MGVKQTNKKQTKKGLLPVEFITLCLLALQVRVTVGDSGFVFRALIKSLVCKKQTSYKLLRERERERAQNSKLYYTRIKILGSCLFLQSVPANLHANRLRIKQ